MSSESQVLLYPIHTEKAINYIEKYNTLIFAVSRTATKQQIREEFERKFGAKVEKVRTLITMRGEKRALIKLSPESSAEEIATRLGLL
ncbi:MAG: 50S ribosomal protein L23 [Desulfurococcales archaeon]|uniref:Large ribosomal subunit protein uL23 n=1 Tax=Fervidicoccus fontis TaxID=683846 RepID=A0A7J3SJG8_9CREN